MKDSGMSAERQNTKHDGSPGANSILSVYEAVIICVAIAARTHDTPTLERHHGENECLLCDRLSLIANPPTSAIRAGVDSRWLRTLVACTMPPPQRLTQVGGRLALVLRM